MNRMLSFLAISFWIFSGISISACVDLPARAEPPVAKVRVTIPTLQMDLASKAATITKGKVKMTAQPILKGAEQKIATVDGPTTGDCRRWCYFYRQHIPYYIHQPRLDLKLVIENDLEQPLRFEKTLLALRIGKKAIPKEQYRESLEDLSGRVVLPGEVVEMEFRGPAFASIPSPTDITFALYDVVTELDSASNPAKRSAFEWKYHYATTPQIKVEDIGYECKSITSGVTCTSSYSDSDTRVVACAASLSECAKNSVDKTPLVNMIPKVPGIIWPAAVAESAPALGSRCENIRNVELKKLCLQQEQN